MEEQQGLESVEAPIEEQAAPVEEVTQEAEAPAEKPQELVSRQEFDGVKHDLVGERQRRAAAERRAAELEQQFRVGNERLQQILELQAKQYAPLPIDEAQDPFGASLQEIKELKRQQAEILRQQQERTQAEQIRMQQEYIINRTKEDEAAFAQTHPDYLKAFDYVKTVKAQEYLHKGFPEHEIENHLRNEWWQIITNSLNNGQPIAEKIYNIAKTMGYRTEATASADTLDKVRAGQSAVTGGGGGAGKPNGLPSLEALGKMSEAEFMKATSDPKNWEKIMMGGR